MQSRKYFGKPNNTSGLFQVCWYLRQLVISNVKRLLSALYSLEVVKMKINKECLSKNTHKTLYNRTCFSICSLCHPITWLAKSSRVRCLNRETFGVVLFCATVELITEEILLRPEEEDAPSCWRLLELAFFTSDAVGAGDWIEFRESWSRSCLIMSELLIIIWLR